MIEVVKPGLLTTIQDLGRSGYAHLGVTRSGALDQPALILANRLVGNPDGAAALETTLTGVSLRTEVATRFAVTGAPAPITVDGEPASPDQPLAVPPGSRITIGATTSGVRSYVSFAGGITVAPVLRSRSTDTLSGIGPPPLRAGHILPVGRSAPEPERDPAVAGSTRDGSTGGRQRPGGFDSGTDAAERVVRIRFGPRHDWFTAEGRAALLCNAYKVTVKSNRVGARLAGPVLARAVGGELPSEGIVVGAIQVPADGQPIVFLADHPTTGGYPVIGVVIPEDLPILAQARPGVALRFEEAGRVAHSRHSDPRMRG